MRSGLALVMSLGLTASLVAACSSGDSVESTDSAGPQSTQPLPGNRYSQTNLAANNAAYKAQFVFPDMINAWGVAIRPQGAGGHFWVGAGDTSFEFVGDVTDSSDEELRILFQNKLEEVAIPNADDDTSDDSMGKVTGVIFNPAPIESDVFAVRDQPVQVDGAEQMLSGSARFIFATDSGSISAWTEQGDPAEPPVRHNGPAKEVFNGADEGMAFFGIALAPGNGETMLASDFGEDPQIRQFDKDWNLVPTQGFANPFATGDAADAADPAKGKKTVPGDLAPFNIVTEGNRVFVMYATTSGLADQSGKFDPGEEDSLNIEQEKAAKYLPARGKVAEFDASGNLVRVLGDEDRLNAPWGVAIAPDGFGPLRGKILIANFAGAGRILAFDDGTGEFVDYLRDEDGNPAEIQGIWSLLFGNGESLGDSNALYFTAGPQDEADGLFGALRLKG